MIEIKLFEDKNFKGYTFIEGFPGAGLVGPMTISYMIDKLQMKYVGYMESENFPPLISIHKSQPMPPIRVYCSEKERIITIFAEFAITIELVSALSDSVYDFIKKNGITDVYSIGGIPMQQDGNDTPFVVASNSKSLKKAQDAGLKSINEGVATGVSAMLLIRSSINSLNAIDIMVPVKQNVINPIYAEIAIKSINKLMNLNIDVAELEKEAKAVEVKIRELINKHKETHDNYKKTVDSTGPSMYA
ncbi:MAG: proteasome assembly chaperone family protein [Candidatus Micrarchaeota archaeon]|nr:proteasome assembly chaperone family protein [Candidatus Micrarchaeota archaeon]